MSRRLRGPRGFSSLMPAIGPTNTVHAARATPMTTSASAPRRGHARSAFDRCRRLRTLLALAELLELVARRPEIGGELQRLLEVRPRLSAAPLPGQRETEVEVIPVVGAVARDRGSKGGLGLVEF